MSNRQLDRAIIAKLMKKTKKSEKTIRKDISLLRRDHGRLPINTVAQIYARQNNTSILTKLTNEEKEKLPNLEIESSVRIKSKNSNQQQKKNKIFEFIKYETTDRFIKAHISEVNKAYTYGCYTAAFILCRKIIENLLTDIIRKKFPQNKKENIEMFFDTSKGRTMDFSEIISNLRKHSKDFGPDKTLLEQILTKSDKFKDDANKKAHSWYHIVRSKTELNETHVQDILAMIVKLESNLI